MKKPFRLSRRAFLGGAGATLGLPLLEAMLPIGKTAFAQPANPTRMLCYYIPNGVHMPAWTPSQSGADYALTPILQPLANFKDDMMVISNLTNAVANAGPDGPGDHARGTGSFITASRVTKTAGDDIHNGVSLDQVAAGEIGRQTRYASIEVGMDGGGTAGNCDSGYSCAYTRNISWAGPQTPMPKITNPRSLYDRLFSGLDATETSEQSQQRARLNQSVLDYVLSDIQSLQQKLGATDRAKLDEYFTGVEELEHGLTSFEAGACVIPDRPSASGYNVTEKARLLADLMTIAFQCDLTRVQTFMMANAASERVYDFLGINTGHHTISHHQSQQANFDMLLTIDIWEIEQFAYLLGNLKNTTDAGGTPLLDSCMVFLSSEISDGDWHNHNNLPVILAGSANGYFSTGQHVRFSSSKPIANLYMSMLDAIGAPVSSFGDDSTGLLESIT